MGPGTALLARPRRPVFRTAQAHFLMPEVEDFIIADEPATQAASQPGPQAPSQAPFNIWAPKVDLLSFASPAFQNAKVKERQYAGGDTLDEPVLETLKRDLSKIWKRLTIVVWPIQLAKLAKKQQSRLIDFASQTGVNLPESLIRDRRISVGNEEDVAIDNFDNIELNSLDWDMWGPLVFSLVYSVVLGMSASSKQTNSVFSGLFACIWLLFIIVGLNVQLLGGNISFMSAISAVGYSMFPITVGEIVCALVIRWKLIRLAVMLVLCAWSVYSGVLSLKCSGVMPGRVLLAVYPVFLMYALLAWLSVIT